MLREGYCLPFLSAPPLSNVPVPLPSYSPSSIKGAALEEVTLGLIAKGAVELVPLPSPGFYSRLFVVWKTSGSWRPVIDLSHLNRFVDVSHFQMETIQSVLLSVRQGDWMASIDLKEAYLQVPVHPASRHFLRFVFRGQVYQFKALCFGLSTAPQVFTRVMAPVSAILHSLGIRMRRYLDDWLVQSSSRESLLRDLQTVLSLCHELGIVINPLKSNLVPSQVVQYLGVVINSTSFRASPSVERVTRLQSTAVAFQSCASPPASLWLSLLGVLSSLAHLVPGGRLRMRSLQLCLHRSWNRQDMEAPVLASMESSRSPVVAPSPSSLPRRVSAPSVSRPSLLVRRLGRGLGRPSRLSGRFRPVGRQSGSVVNQRQGTPSCSARAVPVPVSSPGSHGGCLLRQHHSGRLPSQGGWHQISSPQQLSSGDLTLDGVPLHPPDSTVSSGLQQCPGRRSISPSPIPTYRMVSQHDRISVFEKTVAGSNRLVCHLSKSSLFDLLLPFPGSEVSRHGRLSPVLGRPSGLCVPSGGYNSACSSEAPGLQGDGAHLGGSPLGSAPLVFGPSPAVAGSSSSPTIPSRPPALASVSSSLPGSPSAQASCLATLQRYTRAAGFSSAVAEQSSLARRPSSRTVYQARWSVYRDWCHSNGHSVSRPTLAKVADFLYWLRFTRGLSVSSLRGYRSALSAVFCFHLPSLSSDPVIRNLLRSFRLSSAERVMRPPAWDLSKVLTNLVSPAFEPLSQASFRALTMKTLFLLALATAKRVGELQALSSIVTFVAGDACLSYIPQFVAKSELLTRSIPRSFLVKSLADFAAGLDDDLLPCPVRALRLYLPRARSLSPGRHRLFVSPRRPTRHLSKNAMSFFLREVISAAGATRPQVGSLRAHEVRSVSTSVAFHRNWSVSSVLESATWASSSVFSSFYLRDIQHEYDGLLSLGPFVAAGSRIG